MSYYTSSKILKMRNLLKLKKDSKRTLKLNKKLKNFEADYLIMNKCARTS